jgi:glycosyltransferase involved in cell wall biosynthesis
MTIQFHLVSFEGPDPYARAGGIATRVSGLGEALADAGYETHLWFVGDPDLEGHEARGRLTLHRWCQWISRYHPEGVYAGEEGKRADLVRSLPPFLVNEILLPRLLEPNEHAVILTEEWHTVDAVLHLDWLLRQRGLRDKVTILWNANNVFGFERIDWSRLSAAATITTVSRYMARLMRNLGIDPMVIPNGLGAEALQPPDRAANREFSRRLGDRITLSKVARWDPDKQWLLAIDIVGELKRHGARPLFLARGGVEAHGAEVLARAAANGLRVLERGLPQPDASGLFNSLNGLANVDVLSLRSHLSPQVRRIVLGSSSAVLANSRHEPFGLVGLETMAVGGLACTGGTGEDYAVAGWNGLVLQTGDPREFVTLFHRLRADPVEARALRRRARSTARRYAWPEVIQRHIFPQLHVASLPALRWPQHSPLRRASMP